MSRLKNYYQDEFGDDWDEVVIKIENEIERSKRDGRED